MKNVLRGTTSAVGRYLPLDGGQLLPLERQILHRTALERRLYRPALLRVLGATNCHTRQRGARLPGAGMTNNGEHRTARLRRARLWARANRHLDGRERVASTAGWTPAALSLNARLRAGDRLCEYRFAPLPHT